MIEKWVYMQYLKWNVQKCFKIFYKFIMLSVKDCPLTFFYSIFIYVNIFFPSLISHHRIIELIFFFLLSRLFLVNIIINTFFFLSNIEISNWEKIKFKSLTIWKYLKTLLNYFEIFSNSQTFNKKYLKHKLKRSYGFIRQSFTESSFYCHHMTILITFYIVRAYIISKWGNTVSCRFILSYLHTSMEISKWCG